MKKMKMMRKKNKNMIIRIINDILISILKVKMMFNINKSKNNVNFEVWIFKEMKDRN